MDAALFTLLRLRRRAAFRRLVQNLKTPRGAIFFLCGAGLFGVWLAPSLFALGALRRGDPAAMHTTVPLALLAFCLLNLITQGDDKAIHFTPAEVNFLFTAPFPRRQLLLYRLVTVVSGVALSAVFLVLVTRRYTTSWVAAYGGLVLALLFIQLFGMATVMFAQTLSRQLFTRVRKVIVAGTVALVALGVYHVWTTGTPAGESVWQAFRHSWGGRAVLLPFTTFAHAMTAPALFPDFVQWAGLGFLFNAVLVAVVLWLDSDFLESSANQSERTEARLQRARRGGATGWMAGTGKVRTRLPQPPWLGGAGPVLWRQLTTAVRCARVLLFSLLLLAVVVWPSFLVTRGSAGEVYGLIPVLFVSMMLTARLTFDFRGDLDHMDSLKALPVGPTAIVLGQLATPVMLLTLLQWLVLGILAALTALDPQVIALVAVFVVPANVVLFAVDNLLFLLFPTRATATGPADFQFIGRTILLAVAKFALFGVCAGVAGVVGFVCYVWFGHAVGAFVVAGWLMLAGVAGALVPALVAAYRRFDLSLDTPP